MPNPQADRSDQPGEPKAPPITPAARQGMAAPSPEPSHLDTSPLPSSQSFLLAAILSALIPGLGQAVKRQTRHAAGLIATGAALIACTGVIGQTGGVGAALFFFMLIVLPWWTLQSYDAFLPCRSKAAAGSSIGSDSQDNRTGLRDTLNIVWRRAHDIRYLGALFLLTAMTDLYIIVANPTYSLTIFCIKPAGLWGLLAKAQSPTLHTLIGYGFIRLRRWSLLLYLAYAAFGLMNATTNYACFGYGRVRTVFLLSLLAFTAYVLWRKDCFPVSGRRQASL